LLTVAGYSDWMVLLKDLGTVYLSVHQLESAKRCCLRTLAFPHQKARDSVMALHGMARYHQERREWAALTECCKEALTLYPEVKGDFVRVGCFEERLLLFLADAAEAQGDMGLAREYDDKAKKLLSEFRGEAEFAELVACDRREAIALLAIGRAEEAVQTLKDAPKPYKNVLILGINLSDLCMLQPILAALKVFVNALMQTGSTTAFSYAQLVQADVEETEAILAGYWEGTLEETRRELRERQRGGGPGEAGAGEEGTEAKKKSKAAKRKQQKRKAQQQKKSAEMAQAAAAAAAEHGGEVAAGQQEQGQEQQQQQAQEEQEEELQEEQEQEQEGKEENCGDTQEAVTAAAVALSAMIVSGAKGQQEEDEEEDEDECSVCLNAIESNDADNPAGPPLACGHRYHAFCLHFWAERCRLKCIEPTCPYCRSPLQEMEST